MQGMAEVLPINASVQDFAVNELTAQAPAETIIAGVAAESRL
jgi:hypothetical protein